MADAWVAQSVEQRTRNAQVVGSSPTSGSISSPQFQLSHALATLWPNTRPNNRPRRSRAGTALEGRPMAGSIRKRPDRGANVWELRVFLGRDSTGRVRHRQLTFRGSERAAKKELTSLVAAQDFLPEVPAEPETTDWNQTTTVNDAIEGWKQNGWEDLSPVTVRRYENVWKVHIEKSIGRRRIATLTPYEVERYFRQLKSAGCGRETVRYVRSVLNRACRLARKWSNSTLPNPIADTELPSWNIDERAKPVRSPSVPEVQRLLAKAIELDPRFATCLRVIAATGMRRSEACALRWSDFDWKKRTIVIDEAVVAGEGGATVKTPKTRAS